MESHLQVHLESIKAGIGKKKISVCGQGCCFLECPLSPTAINSAAKESKEMEEGSRCLGPNVCKWRMLASAVETTDFWKPESLHLAMQSPAGHLQTLHRVQKGEA